VETLTLAVRELQSANERQRAELELARSTRSQHEHRVTELLTELRKRMPAPLTEADVSAVKAVVDELGEAAYLGFEDRFRGSRDEITARLAHYLPLVEQARTATGSAPVLDLGCGRGEWLELLTNRGMAARGADSNSRMVESCRERKLDVTRADALEFLAAVPDASCAAVTAIHVVEHLPLDVLERLLGESLRVLKPGGALILETPNPKNLVVGAAKFYVDPSHHRPLYPDTLAFFVEKAGFSRTELQFLHPDDTYLEQAKQAGPFGETVNEWLFGPRDYAVVAYRP
jgi:O-antigen chain-terminating methyltransferase